jgi:hypothetical protein
MLAHVSKKIRKSKQKSRKLEKNERKSFWTLAITSPVPYFFESRFEFIY